MKQVIDTGLPPLKQPFSWAVKASGQMLFTAHGPVRQDGSIDTGPIAVSVPGGSCSLACWIRSFTSWRAK